MEVQYLTQQHLAGFEHYKYSSLDTSPLSIYVMHPFWNNVVKLVPKWVAPNLLTFVGFLFTVGNFMLFVWYDYEFYASSDDHPEFPSIPHWVWGFASINFFLAYTLDGIDGKQARRTGTSGPLGELFDHGLDSWTALFIPTCMYSAFGRSANDYSIQPVRMYFCLWNVFINFYISHWEKYNTGVLFLPWGYDASMLATILVFAITSVCGHQVWKFNMPGDVSAGHMFELLFYVSAIVTNLPVALWNIYRSYKDKTGKMRTFYEAVRPLVPVVTFIALSAIWVLYSPSDIMNADPRCVFFLTGSIFSNICCRLIVTQMSNTRCEVWNWMLLPVLVGMCMSLVLPPALNGELVILYILAVFCTLAHIHYGACVVRQMCKHFKIYCFKIKPHDE
ncbi:ethanolaminephosphotransferase 1-like [Ischnura elegans]|uniref:ethanolaminephosphotransferase 1-like n=1 Tax=Ischnura elegans TaxID=197161 RepID=UPI001ED87617|nr:ethanolaminephosphotransferase 1-like [Ischnura elegans]